MSMSTVPSLGSATLIDDDVDVSGYSLLNPGECTTTGNITLADVLNVYPRDGEGNLLHNEASQKDIRGLLGRGSFSTIGKFIKVIEKLDMLSKAPILSEDIPSIPKQLMESIWERAYQHARAQYASRGEINANKLLIATEKVAVLNKRTDQLLTELDNANETIESLKSSCENHDLKMAELNEAHNQSIINLNTQIETLQKQIEGIKLQHAKEMADAENVMKMERLRWDATREAMLADKERMENKMVEMRALFDKFNPQPVTEQTVDTNKKK